MQLPAAASSKFCCVCIHSTSSTLYSTFTTLSKNTTQLNIAFIFQRSPPASPGQRVRQITFGHDAAETCMHTHIGYPPPHSLFDLTASQMGQPDRRLPKYNGSNGTTENTRTHSLKCIRSLSDSSLI